MWKTGFSCIRHTLCLSNLLFWFVGSCMLGIGVWLHISFDNFSRVLPSYHVLSADNLMITVGALTILISFAGCCGAWFQSRCLLSTYLGVIILVMCLQVLAGTLGFVYQAKIRDTLQGELLSGIRNQYSPNDTFGVARTWDKVQTHFNCCGVNNYDDWYDISAWPDEKWVPESCCVSPDEPELNSTTTTPKTSTEKLFERCGLDEERDLPYYRSGGCYPEIQKWLTNNLSIIGITCIAFAFVQFFSIVASLLIICTMEHKKNHHRGVRGATSGGRSTYNRVPTL